MNELKVLLASANYPNKYYNWAPWNKEANIAISKLANVKTEVFAPLPHSLPFKFVPYHQLAEIPLKENSVEGVIHRPRFWYLLPKKIFYGFEGSFYRRSVNEYVPKNVEKPDLVHCHHVYPDGYGFIDTCKKLDVPLVVDVHSPRLFDYLNQDIGKKVSDTLNFADKIICISEEIVNLAKKFDIKEEKIEFIPLGVDIDRFKEINKDLIREKFNIGHKKVLLFVGNLNKMKGIEFLIKAIYMLKDNHKKDLKLIIVGEGPEKQNLINLSENLGIKNIIKFWGVAKGPILQELYSLADIFILPSLSEGRPVVIYEAMASNCAIISTNVGGSSEQVKDGYNGLLVEPKNIDQLTVRINYLLENENLIGKMGENGRKRIAEEGWTWNVYAKKLGKLYEELSFKEDQR